MTPFRYDEIRERVADALERAAEAHDGGRHRELSTIHEEVDVPETRGEGDRFAKIAIALEFLDGWVDASNHDWQYYEGFSQQDWPRLARSVATALRADREISAPSVMQRFDLRRRGSAPGVVARILRAFARRF